VRHHSARAFDERLHVAVKSYLIDGKEARGEDYVGAIDALPSDDLPFFRVRVPDKGTVMVSTLPGGFIVTDERLDGSSWTSPVLAKEPVKGLVGLFLDGHNAWREGLEWELTMLTTRNASRRTLRIVLIGAIVVALAAWLARLFRK